MMFSLRSPDSDVIRIAEYFEIAEASVERVGGGFSGAEVYKVTAVDQRQYAVRCTPLDSSLPRDRLQALHQLLSRMQTSGLRTIAVPLPHRLNNRVWQPEHSANRPAVASFSETVLQLQGNLWQAEPWLPGEAVLNPPAPAQLRSAVQELNAFHQSAAAQTKQQSANEWFCLTVSNSPGILRRRAIVRELSGGLLSTFRRRFSENSDAALRELALRICEILERWLPWLSARLESLADHPFRLQPVIRDLWSAHVLLTNGQVSGLIDLSAMSTDHVCFDISRLFRSWYGASSSAVRNAIEEFEKLQPLDPSERQMLQALDAATVLLSPVTWLRRLLTEGEFSQCDATIIARLTVLTRVAEQFEPL
jgi:hypothetical protein